MMVKCKLFVFIVLCVSWWTIIECQTDLIVETTRGYVRGRTYLTRFDTPYHGFIGIPFASPPTGVLRFANPEKPRRWSGIYNATSFQPPCLQLDSTKKKVIGSEDCLYLNVFRPVNSTNVSNYPVMVHIYGGAFSAGSTMVLGPEYFLLNGKTIFVSISYRVGVFGFLSTGDDNSPGNYALKDQALALKWVRKNIRAFGGNPNSVTLIGQSAGAVSVQMHMMSPLSQGLFHRAIIQSGTAIAPFNEPTKRPLELARLQAKAVGIRKPEYYSNEELVDRLRVVDANLLVASVLKLKVANIFPFVLYRPVVEKESSGAFITKNWKRTWESGAFKHIPLLFTFVSNEGAIVPGADDPAMYGNFTLNFDDFILRTSELTPKTSMDAAYIVQSIKNFYFNGTNDINYLKGQRFIDLISDRLFYYPLYQSIEQYIQYADLTKAPVYVYKFDFDSPLTIKMLSKDYSVFHAVDILYLYNQATLDIPVLTVDGTMSAYYVDAMATFAQTGVVKQFVPFSSCRPSFRIPFSIFNNDLQQMCDYQLFKRNTATLPESIDISVTNTFDLEAVQFWNGIMKFSGTGQLPYPVLPKPQKPPGHVHTTGNYKPLTSYETKLI